MFESETLSYQVALATSVGTLFLYVGNAIRLRASRPKQVDHDVDFNLGLPRTSAAEKLFAISLVAAGTSISTVFLFFLTAGPIYGYWLFLCPALFGLGNWVMYHAYKLTYTNGYFDEDSQQDIGGAGLIPFLGQRLTSSSRVGWFLATLSLINLLAVFVLELIVGVEVIGYLVHQALGVNISTWAEFSIFAASISLMLAYVYIGGFRAVVSSDVWQMRLIQLALAVALVSVTAYFLKNNASLSTSLQAPTPNVLVLWTFVLNIAFGNLLIPMSQESSWQRFRAFRGAAGFDAKNGMVRSVTKAIVLWSALIVLAFLLQNAMAPLNGPKLNSMSNVLQAFLSFGGHWFSLVVYPLMAVAVLSAMYSTADTCVSSLLYLTRYPHYTLGQRISSLRKEGSIGFEIIAMITIFIISMGTYALVRIWFNPTILQLIFSVFSNLVVISPTIIATALLRPKKSTDPQRSTYVLISLALGTLSFWACAVAGFILGTKYLWLNQLSLLVGLMAAFLPMLPLLFHSDRNRP